MAADELATRKRHHDTRVQERDRKYHSLHAATSIFRGDLPAPVRNALTAALANRPEALRQLPNQALMNLGASATDLEMYLTQSSSGRGRPRFRPRDSHPTGEASDNDFLTDGDDFTNSLGPTSGSRRSMGRITERTGGLIR